MSPPTRNTPQRRAVIDVCESARRPLTIEEIHRLARVSVPAIGLRTVYRIVATLVDDTILLPIDYPGQPTRYETVTGDHRPHFICNRCGRLFVLDTPSPDPDIPSNPPFEITGAEVIFYGRCHSPDCSPSRPKPQPGPGIRRSLKRRKP